MTLATLMLPFETCIIRTLWARALPSRSPKSLAVTDQDRVEVDVRRMLAVFTTETTAMIGTTDVHRRAVTKGMIDVSTDTRGAIDDLPWIILTILCMNHHMRLLAPV